jgi:hypothetical protein
MICGLAYHDKVASAAVRQRNAMESCWNKFPVAWLSKKVAGRDRSSGSIPMKFTTVLTAAVVLVAVSGSAFAQGMSGQGPNTGMNPSTPPKNKNGPVTKQTGAKDRSPASQNSGAKQEK